MNRPNAWSSRLSSSSAMLMPQTMAPKIWLRAVMGLRMRPPAIGTDHPRDVDRAEFLVHATSTKTAEWE